MEDAPDNRGRSGGAPTRSMGSGDGAPLTRYTPGKGKAVVAAQPQQHPFFQGPPEAQIINVKLNEDLSMLVNTLVPPGQAAAITVDNTVLRPVPGPGGANLPIRGGYGYGHGYGRGQAYGQAKSAPGGKFAAGGAGDLDDGMDEDESGDDDPKKGKGAGDGGDDRKRKHDDEKKRLAAAKKKTASMLIIPPKGFNYAHHIDTPKRSPSDPPGTGVPDQYAYYITDAEKGKRNVEEWKTGGPYALMPDSPELTKELFELVSPIKAQDSPNTTTFKEKRQKELDDIMKGFAEAKQKQLYEFDRNATMLEAYECELEAKDERFDQDLDKLADQAQAIRNQPNPDQDLFRYINSK